ncbi:hypothetical protein [Croceimicrobium sp.]|uniref:hypothetical protein n=1 Tax=Croceimicrobium sp. TaxID=2828340 RepID=UPI003BAA9453
MKALVAVFLLMALVADQKDWKSSELKGLYIHEDGEPGRIVENSDGSESHIMPIVFSRRVLDLKSWGRFEERNEGFTETMYVQRGRWKLKGDSIYLRFIPKARRRSAIMWKRMAISFTAMELIAIGASEKTS